MKKYAIFVFLSFCAWWDIRKRKIPNPAVLTAIAAFGIACFIRGPSGNGVEEAFWGLSLFAGRVILTAVIMFPLFLFRMMGAGDIKAMAVISGYMGWYNGFEIIFYGLAVSAAWSVIYMLRKRILLRRINYFRVYFIRLFLAERMPAYYCAAEDTDGAGFCLAPFLWIGYMIWLLFSYLLTG